MKEKYDYQDIRRLVDAAFDDGELEVLCFDLFPEVREKFTAGQTKSARVVFLADHAKRHGKTETLLRETKKRNPHQFAKFAQLLQITGEAPSETCETAISSYLKKVSSLHDKIPLSGFRTPLRVSIRVADIYVPLGAMIDRRVVGKACFADASDAEEQIAGRDCGQEISIPDAFSETEKTGRRGIVILGDPGSGKTTHLKRVLLWCAGGGLAKLGLPDDTLPVFLPLRELSDADLNKSLDAFIQRQLDLPHLDTPPGFGRMLLDRGNLLLLFDGLDEVPESSHRSKISRYIETALAVHTSCRFVVTSRFAGYTEDARLNADFLEMHLRPMSAEQAAAFIHNWYRIVEIGTRSDPDQAEIIAKEKADNLVERLRKPEFRARRVFEMTRNPLLLTNLCLVHLDRGNLPHTRAALYEECVDVLLERWREAAKVATRIRHKSGVRVLQPAALWMHGEENRTRAKGKELAPIIEPAIKAVGWKHGSGEEFLKAVRDESGLLTGWGDGSFGFMHLGFQEYLAAREIRSRAYKDSHVLKTLAGHFGESWWREVTLLLLALEEPSHFEPFMREVVKLPAFAEHPDLADMCLDDSLEVWPGPFAEVLAQEPGKDKDLWERQLAALRILERLDKDMADRISADLQNHPYDKIRKRVGANVAETLQKTAKAERGGYELVFIPGGVFMMGSPETEEGRYDREGPQHEIRVPDFYLGRYPVTNEEYGRFLAEHPNEKEPAYWGNSQYNQARQPVVGISWHEAQKYAEWAGLQLPSEPQWEYACRAGTTTRFYTGDAEADLDRAGWYGGNSGSRLHPVGEKEPNALGLYDMHGNVFEWTRSLWGDKYDEPDFKYPYDPDDGREDMSGGAFRVLRGGSWVNEARYCRSAFRDWCGPDYRDGYRGFRLARLPGL